jgi:hypothetical protein
MLPDIVTFWHGPLDPLRRTCLRSQVAAGHKVTIYSFDPLPGLPDGVGNAEAEAILPHAFSERLRFAEPDGSWRDWTLVQFSDFFRMRLMAMRAGLWCDADVLLLKAIELDPVKPYFAWERARLLGNSVLYLPAADPIVAAYTRLMATDTLEPDWLSPRHRLLLKLRRLSGRSCRAADLSCGDLWPGFAHRARAPSRRGGLRAAEAIILCRACRAEALLRALKLLGADRGSRGDRLAHLAQGLCQAGARHGQPLRLGKRTLRRMTASRF